MSGLFKLGFNDLLKGCIVAALGIILTGLWTILQTGHFPGMAELSMLLSTGLAAGLAYLTKNLFTNSDGQTFKAETK